MSFLNGGRAHLVCAVLISFGWACDSAPTGTTLRVDLRTDFVPAAEFDAVAVYVGEGDVREEFSHVVRPGRDYLRGVALGDLATRPGAHVAEVVLFQDGEEVISRTVSVIVEAGLTVVTVVITRDCRGVMCPGDGNPLLESCLGAQCTDPRCTVETPEFCPEGICFVDSECPALGCGAPACVANVCLYEPDDTACESGFRCDLDEGCVAAPGDAGPFDGGVDSGMDGGDVPLDAPVDVGTDVPFDAGPPPGCPAPDPSTVYLFDFESLNDRASALSGEVRGMASLASGDSPCGGDSLQVAGDDGRWFIADRPEFQLDRGSIDFWVKPGPISAATVGLMSRDEANQDTLGQLSIFHTWDGRLVLRVQTMTSNIYRCGPALVEGRWYRVGANFGPDRVDFYLDGTLLTGSGMADIFNAGGTMCDTAAADHSIAGNINPFVFGVSGYRSDPGDDLPSSLPAIGWQFDHVRLSDTYRDYAGEL